MGTAALALHRLEDLLASLKDSHLPISLTAHDAGICVDGQNDFAVPGAGALYVPGAEDILQPGAKFLEQFPQERRFRSGDWHPYNHKSFTKNGGTWPEHCIQNEWGAEQHSILEGVPVNRIVLKGTDPNMESYGAVCDENGNPTGLLPDLQGLQISRVFVFMLAFDFCVGETALQLAKSGMDTRIVLDLTRAVDTELPEGNSVDLMVGKLLKAGVGFVVSDQIMG